MTGRRRAPSASPGTLRDRPHAPQRRPAPDHLARLRAAIGNRALGRLLARQPAPPPAPAPAPAPAAPVAAAHAAVSPQDEYSAILNAEVRLLANATAIVRWLRSRRAAAGAGTAVSVTAAELLADAKLKKTLKPVPKAEADVRPTLDLLVFYSVLVDKGGTFEGILDATSGDLATARLEAATTTIKALATDFDARAAQLDSVNPIGLTRMIDISMAAGTRQEKQADRDAVAAHAALEAQLAEHVVLRTPDARGKPRAPVARVTVDVLPAPTPDARGVDIIELPIAGAKKPLKIPAADVAGIEPIETGSDPATIKLRAALEARIARARRALARAQGYRTFALEVADFLERLRTRNTGWVAGTYPRHSWGEFSIDVFLSGGQDAQGFFRVAAAEAFFDDLNATALEDGPWGTFQWRAIYNDARVIATVNARYGRNRIITRPHHGPAPDKLHIHLDVRPTTLVPDAVTGFTVNSSGRVDPL